MKSSDQLQSTASFAVLLVGDPKCGKSSLALGFPDPAVIDWDLNLGSAMRRAKGVTFDVFQPSVADKDLKIGTGIVKAGQKVPEDWQWAATLVETNAICTNPKYKTIVVDGLGLMCVALCEHIVRESKASGSNKTGKMELQNYGELARQLRSYIMTLRASGKMVVVTSHQTADKDDMTGALRYYLAIPGQSKDTLTGAFSDAWAIQKVPVGIDGEKYEIRTKATARSVPGIGCSFEFPEKGAMDITGKSPLEVVQKLLPLIQAK